MKRIFAVALASGIILGLGGCQEIATDTGSGPGRMVVRLMDSPAGYDAINIYVDSVRVHYESGDSLSNWYTISRTPAVYNLLAFSQGKDTVIADGVIPAGYYSQMRLYIGNGSNIVVGGVIEPLEIPSGSQSGLKLNIQASVVSGVAYEVKLDFDAARSIVVTGNGRYKLKPVIKVISAAISGSLSGVVLPDTTKPTVWAIAGTDTSSTFTNTTGYFKFPYLAPAVYLLRIVPADTTFRDTTLTNVAVLAAQNTDIGTITLRKK